MYEYFFTRHLRRMHIMTTIKKNAATNNTVTTDSQNKVPTSVVVIAGVSTETPIEFRKEKFADHITPELAASLVDVIKDFNQKPAMTALGTLWKLTIRPEATLKSLGITTVNAETPDVTSEQLEAIKDMIYVPAEVVDRFRNELRYQYAIAHPGFPEVSYPDNCAQAYKALNNATVKDHVTCAIILDHCKTVIANRTQEEIDKAIGLLNNPKDTCAFGGVRSLSFYHDEADYLKRFAPKIGALLKALDDDKKSHMTTAEPTEEDGNRPFAGLAKQLEEKGFVLAEEPVVASATDETAKVDDSRKVMTEPVELEEDLSDLGLPASVSEPLTLEVIQQNQDAISSFITAYQQLEDLGIDPFTVIAKSDAISKLLEGIKGLA